MPDQPDIPKSADDEPDAILADDCKVISTTAVGLLSTVHFYDSTLEHIAEQHPEFRTLVVSLEYAMHDAIADPTLVLQSNTSIHTSGYKYVSERHSHNGRPLVVAVTAVTSTSGRVSTAYFTRNPSGNVIFTVDTDKTDDA